MKNPNDPSASHEPIFCHPNHGPYFYTAFFVPADANSNTRQSFTVHDIYKDLPKTADGKWCMYIDGDKDFQISEVEIYKVIPN